MDDLVAHVDRRRTALDRLLDDLDRADDAGAEATRLGEDDLERRTRGGIRRGVGIVTGLGFDGQQKLVLLAVRPRRTRRRTRPPVLQCN
ncbi:hypothetical protein [Sphingomonas sp. GC_Shp_1]|uniref:hypothetical protein n=1 Tax=unclassified Sphingomonas TaxID=196159 RepID=UPI00226AB005